MKGTETYTRTSNIYADSWYPACQCSGNSQCVKQQTVRGCHAKTPCTWCGHTTADGTYDLPTCNAVATLHHDRRAPTQPLAYTCSTHKGQPRNDTAIIMQATQSASIRTRLISKLLHPGCRRHKSSTINNPLISHSMSPLRPCKCV